MAIYTKSDIAELLGIPSNNTSNIKRKLTQLGYEYKCSGKGDTYLIEILREPMIENNLTIFAKSKMGLKIRREDDFAHFLHYIFLSPEELQIPCRSYRSLEANTYYNYKTIQTYMKALKECGALIQLPQTAYYYATKYEYFDIINDDGDYEKHLLTKTITRDEWTHAYDSYFAVYNEMMTDIDKKPDLVEEMVIDYANQSKKQALNGWWACQLSNEMVIINKNWEHLPQLLSLLEKYKYEPYKKMAIGNCLEDQKKLEEKEERIQQQLKEKRLRLAENSIKLIPEDKIFTSEDEYMEYIIDTGIWKDMRLLLKNDDKQKKKEMEERWSKQFYN